MSTNKRQLTARLRHLLLLDPVGDTVFRRVALVFYRTLCFPENVTKRKGLSIEDQRADLVRRITVPGARRIELLAELAEVNEILLPMVTEGIDLGITTRRIGELTGLSGSAVFTWAKRGRNN